MSSINFCLKKPMRKYPAVGVSSVGWLNETNKFLPQLLNARTLLVPKNDQLAATCSGFVQWGILESESKARLRQYAQSLNRPLAFIEDGFIRSLDIGLSQEPGRSIILDDLGFYYDATKPSRLETILNSSTRFNFLQKIRARRAIELIARERISKYNQAPDTLPAILREPKTHKRILILDQRAGDASIAGALATEENFNLMVDCAFGQGDAEVIVKIHPDAMTPGKFSAVSPALSKYKNDPRLKIISVPVNPYTLFGAVDEVYVVASGMGFEAVMAGKAVTCFGVPYYAGWGLTQDMVDVPRRARKRTAEEVFLVAWILLSRYVDPETKTLVSIEKTVRTLAKERKTKGLTGDLIE